MNGLIGAVLCGALALASLLISIAQFRERGLLINNAYLWASERERETMDKKPHYRQSGIVFAFSAAIFFVMAFECVFVTDWLWVIVGLLTIALLIYALASSIKEQKKQARDENQ